MFYCCTRKQSYLPVSLRIKFLNDILLFFLGFLLLSFLPELECDLRPVNRWKGGREGGKERGREGEGEGGEEGKEGGDKQIIVAVQTYLCAGVN